MDRLAIPLNATLLVALALPAALAILVSPWLALGLVALLWFYAASLRWPLIGFLVIYGAALLMNVNLSTDSPLRALGERYPLALGLAPLLLPLLTARVLARRAPGAPPRLAALDTLPLLLLLWMLASYGWSLDPLHGSSMGLNLILGVGLYFLIQLYVDDRRALTLTLGFTVAWGLVLALMLVLSNKIDTSPLRALQVQLGPDWRFEPSLILYGTRAGGFAPPQIAGTVTTFVFMAGCALWPECGWRARLVLALSAPWLISNLLATGSKGAAGAFVIALAAFIALYPGLRGRRLLAGLAFLAALVAIMVFNVMVLRADRLASGTGVNELSITFRLEFWETGLRLLGERWIGAGLGGFAHLVDPWPGAHNYYFSVLFDAGPVGILLLLGFVLGIVLALARALREIRDPRLRRYLYCLAAALLAFLIHATVDFSYDSAFSWILYGLVVATVRIARRDATGRYNGPPSVPAKTPPEEFAPDPEHGDATRWS
ncbi:hypothetical protein MARPU_14470 [Marichromatium purpuratum 984]|uniref:O-antigen ligase-related domain-containing protein n=1 Tax=Marichromatium purpuratum 984 TaxID=765910 RepID=W0E448_MARPU|nr:O-antigen ligase family protein [Marichromatium purpuratum]AHF05630.1 hypothetical protein MARPU_14470 [Marichromatium purpuratum 984]